MLAGRWIGEETLRESSLALPFPPPLGFTRVLASVGTATNRWKARCVANDATHRSPTSDQTRLPAELKHISKRRKRN